MCKLSKKNETMTIIFIPTIRETSNCFSCKFVIHVIITPSAVSSAVKVCRLLHLARLSLLELRHNDLISIQKDSFTFSVFNIPLNSVNMERRI
jgi:hypothetical protein